MAEEEYIDSYSPVRPITSKVLDQLNALAPQIRAAAKAASISPLAVAAPMAREMNKQTVGDYGSGFMRYLKSNLSWANALYHASALTRYTH